MTDRLSDRSEVTSADKPKFVSRRAYFQPLNRDRRYALVQRQLFVRRDLRRTGIGRAAMTILREHIWPKNVRLTVEVLSANQTGTAFWHSVGYKDYSTANWKFILP